MIQSMTAYAQYAENSSWGSFCWEVKTVNHRYAEFYFKLPDELRELEAQLREIARKMLDRGKLDCFLRLEVFDASSTELEINQQLVTKITQACQKISNLLGNCAPVSPLDILSWPAVVQDKKIDRSRLQADICQGYKQVMEKLKQAREQEGRSLQDLFTSRLAAMVEQIGIILCRYPLAIKNQEEKLRTKINEINMKLDQQRLEQEIVYLINKSDISEEIDRLAVHIKEVERILAQGGAVGRRLDFLMQEMNREANTLASKSADNITSLAAIELKVLIEQMREQVQNIE